MGQSVAEGEHLSQVYARVAAFAEKELAPLGAKDCVGGGGALWLLGHAHRLALGAGPESGPENCFAARPVRLGLPLVICVGGVCPMADSLHPSAVYQLGLTGCSLPWF